MLDLRVIADIYSILNKIFRSIICLVEYKINIIHLIKKGYSMKARYACEEILRYPEVDEWSSSIASSKTKKNYSFYLCKLLKELNITPKKLLKIQNPRKIIMPVINRYKYTHFGAARLMKSAVSNFFVYHGRRIDFQNVDKIPLKREKKSIEIIPAKGQVFEMMAATSSMRDKAIILCLYQSGARINCLFNLNYGMMKNKLFPKIKGMPIRLKITSKIDSKIKNYDFDHYYIFFAKESAKALRRYLLEKIKKLKLKNDKLGDCDPIFSKHHDYKKKISYHSFFQTFKNLIENVGLDSKKIWPNSLRKSFKYELLREGIDPEVIKQMMGHKPKYDGSNIRLNPNFLRSQYMKVNFSPIQSKELISEKESKKEIKTREDEIKRLMVIVEKSSKKR